MPTYNRRQFIPHAIEYFLRQDYANRELIILDDGTDAINDLLPVDERIVYVRLDQKITLGAKLNQACEYARGEIIAHWDDDDWYAPRRLSCQVKALAQNGIEICGINTLLYYDLQSGRAYEYVYPREHRVWLLGSELCYRKKFWESHRFVENNCGMDARFVWSANPSSVLPLKDHTFAVHMIHASNVSPKQTHGSWWRAHSVDAIAGILGADWEFYKPSSERTNGYPRARTIAAKPITVTDSLTLTHQDPISEKNVAPLRNVFACLVHESQECVVDLVRNLRYHDPDSVILLYNGGNDPNLLNHGFAFERYGAVVHPTPRQMKWGWLHGFALDSMKFALDNLSFDTFTVVDSDQIAVRKGYSQYVSQYLSGFDHIGMLSNSPDRQPPNTRVAPAVQAWREFDLWRHWLQRFPQGEEKFVHWSFWPSTVFTRESTADLVNLFAKDEQLNEIMSRSKIWATEEIIFPTVVALLGYRIIPNPCHDDYVKYRVRYSPRQLNEAFARRDVFWMHPIPRQYGDPLRKQIRTQLNDYDTIDLTPGFPGAPAVAFTNGEGTMNEGKEGISVVIPHGGEERLPHLKATLANLRQCKGVGEIIVVETSSRPYALDVSHRWADKYVFTRHQGAFERARALNLGSSFAEYDLILWLDNDLIVPLDFAMRAASELRALQLDYLVPFSSLQYLSLADSLGVMRGEQNPIDCRAVNTIRSQDADGGTGLVKRSFFLRYGGLPEGFRGWGGEDNGWLHKAWLLGRVSRTRSHDQNVYHLFHPNSCRSHLDYTANLTLLNELRAIRRSDEFLRRFPSPTHLPCPWEARKRIVIVTDETEAGTQLAQNAVRQLGKLFEANVETLKTLDDETLGTDPPDALVMCGFLPALAFLGRSPSTNLQNRLLIVAGEQLPLIESAETTLELCGAIITTTPAASDSCKQSGLRVWEWQGDPAIESDARSFALALAQPLSVMLGHPSNGYDDEGERLESSVSAEIPQTYQDLPVWCYWEGPCPEWIKTCQQTILAHAPNARLLTPAEFDRWRDIDRDIDLTRMEVAHRADFIRAFLLARYGGLWIDSDCLVMQPLRPLLEKLREYDFLAHRERSTYVSNGFIGARPGSHVADEFYRCLCDLLRSGKPLGWTSLGSEPLTNVINSCTSPWLELACEEIQPVCWSEPERFFVRRSDAEHEQVFNEQAICYMLSNMAVQDYCKTHQLDDLLAEGSFFRYLSQRALQVKDIPTVVPEPSNETHVNGSHKWRQMPFCLDAISQVAPARVLDLDMGLGRWGLLLRDLYEQKCDRRQWQLRLEGVADADEKVFDHHRFFYDQIHIGEAATIIEEGKQGWDLTIFGNILKECSRPIGEKTLQTALRKSAYVLANVDRVGGAWKAGHNGGRDDVNSAGSLRHFLASHRRGLEVRHETLDTGEGVVLLSQTDPKKLKHDSGLESIFANIHRSNLLVGDESVSGPGSCLVQTAEIRQRLPLLVSAFDVRSFLDAPSGDFHWLRDVNLRLDQYIGVDIVPQLVSQNQTRYGGRGREFVCSNITTDVLPKVDLIFNRDCLVHFSYADIIRALRNFKVSGTKYLLMTTFTNRRANPDIVTGDWRPLNFQLEPFNFPVPLVLINEKCTEAGGIYSDKSLGLWSLASLAM